MLAYRLLQPQAQPEFQEVPEPHAGPGQVVGCSRCGRWFHSIRLFQSALGRAIGHESQWRQRRLNGSCRDGSTGTPQDPRGPVSPRRCEKRLRRFRERTFSRSGSACTRSTQGCRRRRVSGCVTGENYERMSHSTLSMTAS